VHSEWPYSLEPLPRICKLVHKTQNSRSGVPRSGASSLQEVTHWVTFHKLRMLLSLIRSFKILTKSWIEKHRWHLFKIRPLESMWWYVSYLPEVSIWYKVGGWLCRKKAESKVGSFKTFVMESSCWFIVGKLLSVIVITSCLNYILMSQQYYCARVISF